MLEMEINFHSLLDCGSQYNFITNDLTKHLNSDLKVNCRYK